MKKYVINSYGKELNTTLKQLRQEKKLTQQDLADRANIHRTIVSRLEHAKQDMHVSTLLRYLKELDYELIIQKRNKNRN